MEYKILGSNDKLELEKQVGEEIERGWTPHGGVSVCTYKHPDGDYPSILEINAFYFCQAMTRPPIPFVLDALRDDEIRIHGEPKLINEITKSVSEDFARKAAVLGIIS